MLAVRAAQTGRQRGTVASVCAQTYPHRESGLADGATATADVDTVFRRLSLDIAGRRIARRVQEIRVPPAARAKAGRGRAGAPGWS